MGARTIILFLCMAAAPSTFAQTYQNPGGTGSPADLPTSAQAVQFPARSEAWTYVKPGLDLARYRSILIAPTEVYSGKDAQFGKVKARDQKRFAAYLTRRLTNELAGSFRIVTKPARDAAQLRITLLDAEVTHGDLASVSSVLPTNSVTNAVKGIADKPGRLTGSLLFAVELSDSTTGELQVAAVRRKTPDALDRAATSSTTEKAKAIANAVAREIRDKLEKATGRPR